MEEVFRVEGRVLAPLVGGYNREPYSRLVGYEPLRPTEFKGKWRWWLRTAVVSALGPSAAYKEAEKYVNEILGSTSNPSHYQLILNQGECGKRRISLDKTSRIPRIKQRYVEVEKGEGIQIPDFYSFSLIVRKISKIKEKKEDLALRALTIFLLLDGIGSASNRGFGSIVPEQISGFGPASELLRKIQEKPYPSNIRELIMRFVRETVELSNDVFGGKGPTRTLPAVPSLGYRFFDVREMRNLDLVRILERIGKTTLKSYWKRRCNPLSDGRLPENYHTWILGLPRSGYMKGRSKQNQNGEEEKEPHGYLHPGIDRRQSSIKLKIMEVNGRRFVFITGLPSLDWPLDKLRYTRPTFSRKGEPILIKNLFDSPSKHEIINSVFRYAWNCVRRCL